MYNVLHVHSLFQWMKTLLSDNINRRPIREQEIKGMRRWSLMMSNITNPIREQEIRDMRRWRLMLYDTTHPIRDQGHEEEDPTFV